MAVNFSYTPPGRGAAVTLVLQPLGQDKDLLPPEQGGKHCLPLRAQGDARESKAIS